MKFEPITYEQGKITLLDQTKLPEQVAYRECTTVEELWDAIKCLAVRGAPLLGVAAAYGICLGIDNKKCTTPKDLVSFVAETAQYIGTSRPTAVNLFWALERMKKVVTGAPDKTVAELEIMMHNEAQAIFKEDLSLSRAMGKAGNEIIADGDSVLTHCNAGGLATSGYGTALAVLFTAHENGKQIHVYADETRPLLQGSRLTAWELKEYGIPVTVICDNMAATLMRQGKIQKIITGADRIAANGDAANKIGTYSVAVLAKHHGIPFYIAAPYSTIDFSIASGDAIVIEERGRQEIAEGFGKKTVPDGVPVFNPAFDVTPAAFITGIITEEGILMPPYTESLQALR